MISNVTETLKHFTTSGTLLDVQPFKSGRINESFISRWRDGSREYRLLHQRINRYVFKDISRLMQNISLVTTCVRESICKNKTDTREETLTIVPTRDGKLFHVDGQGESWRTYIFIEDTSCFDACPDAQYAYEAARCCGRFLGHLRGLNPAQVFEVLPFFHHTPQRLKALEQSAKNNLAGRRDSALKEVAFATAHSTFASCVVDSLAKGALPLRVIHYDPKINNVLFDKASAKAVGLVDLETCMPGSALYDFGDLVRSAVTVGSEDQKDYFSVGINLQIFEPLVNGFVSGCAGLLVPAELEMLHVAPRLIALTLGARFLTDYLDGDRYFKVTQPEQNLERCRVQFRVVELMEQQEQEMRRLAARSA